MNFSDRTSTSDTPLLPLWRVERVGVVAIFTPSNASSSDSFHLSSRARPNCVPSALWEEPVECLLEFWLLALRGALLVASLRGTQSWRRPLLGGFGRWRAGVFRALRRWRCGSEAGGAFGVVFLRRLAGVACVRWRLVALPSKGFAALSLLFTAALLEAGVPLRHARA
ncbi:hypothetical protein TcWFU_001021 [Taenia crassiceps]|uniref:Uncharacterized protein n=1 Tax=Taenia crassiceps TaxID=6207 RepID=A0ABR4Q3E6_9CEST